jgi:sensor histidine kinase regulating citrate/malate metabolism
LTGASSSGIGLTHVAGLVKSMNGTIRIARSDASGTEFRIEVPWASLETIEQEES